MLESQATFQIKLCSKATGELGVCGGGGGGGGGVQEERPQRSTAQPHDSTALHQMKAQQS